MAIGNNLKEDLASGEARINSALDVAKTGLGAAQNYAATMMGDASNVRNQARLVNTQGDKINATADELAALVPTLEPFRDKLGNYGDELSALAASLNTQANDVFGQGGALVNMDPTKGGLSAEFINHFNLLSPDRYASRYASDTQAAYDNAQAQQMRTLARQGVSAGSGASAALTQQFNRALATALASAKTLGRQKGIDEQGAFLSAMTNAANTLYNMGNATQSQALAAQGQAIDAQKGAANIVATQGGMLQDAGALRQSAGTLFAQGGQLFGTAAGIINDAGQLSQRAFANLQSAYEKAADYYMGAVNASLSAERNGGGWHGVRFQHTALDGTVLDPGAVW